MFNYPAERQMARSGAPQRYQWGLAKLMAHPAMGNPTQALGALGALAAAAIALYLASDSARKAAEDELRNAALAAGRAILHLREPLEALRDYRHAFGNADTISQRNDAAETFWRRYNRKAVGLDIPEQVLIPLQSIDGKAGARIEVATNLLIEVNIEFLRDQPTSQLPGTIWTDWGHQLQLQHSSILAAHDHLEAAHSACRRAAQTGAPAPSDDKLQACGL